MAMTTTGRRRAQQQHEPAAVNGSTNAPGAVAVETCDVRSDGRGDTIGEPCTLGAFHPGRHSWDDTPAEAEAVPAQDLAPAAEEPSAPAPTPASSGVAYWMERSERAERLLEQTYGADWFARHLAGDTPPVIALRQMARDDASFELAADVKAVRGKNTTDGPALEVVLDASIDSRVGDLMGLIGRQFTRVRFYPYAVQQRLPDPQPTAPEGEQLSLDGVADLDGSDPPTTAEAAESAPPADESDAEDRDGVPF